MLSSSLDGNITLCDFTVVCCYLNLSEDMVEDNPLDLENIKESQDENDNLIHIRSPNIVG